MPSTFPSTVPLVCSELILHRPASSFDFNRHTMNALIGTHSSSYYLNSHISHISYHLPLSLSFPHIHIHVYHLEKCDGVGGILWQCLVDIPMLNDTASIQAE